MLGNPFEGRYDPLPPALAKRGFAQHLVQVADDVTLSYVRGPAHGEPLLLIPAQMGTWLTYARIAAELSRDFEVLAVDVTGHGASSWTPGRYTWDAVGTHLAALLTAALKRPALVAGNSSGGILALWLAARHPEAVSAIVLEDAPVFSVEWPRFRDRDRFVYHGLAHAVEVLQAPDRRPAEALMQATDYIDVLIPRGGAQLIRSVKEKARVPVIETGVGNVHIYVDESADLDMATRIVVNAKTQRPSVCNAAENLLVHSAVAPRFLPQLAVAMAAVHAVEYRADERAQPLLPNAVAATEADYTTEFLDYILAVKVVDSATEAIDWINRYTSHHSEAIITRDIARARAFQDAVDAAVVYVNASTRFTDGFVFGLGAEIGISTQKMHTRGPMGLEALTSTKYYVCGEGQIRE